MKEKLLRALVLVSLVLSVFSLVLTFRSNGTNAITNIVGQSSNVTWTKAQLPPRDYCTVYSFSDGYIHLGSLPMWNVTLTLQWSNSTTSTYDLGTTRFWIQGGGYGYVVSTPKEIGVNPYYNYIINLNTHNYTYPRANATSLTAYEIQPPQ